MPTSKPKPEKVVKEKVLTKKITRVPKPALVAKGPLSAPVYSLLGRASGNLTLPKDIFGAKVNKALLSQALRVYLNNQKTHFANAKTRGEVHATTAKMYKQKGTGRARHGARSAPIFVGGGVALGPKFRKVELELPQKMRRAALISSLSDKASEGKIKVVSGLDKASGKTKEITTLLKDLSLDSVLVVGESVGVARAIRNLPNAQLSSPSQLNVLDVIKYQNLVLTKEAIEKLQTRLGAKND